MADETTSGMPQTTLNVHSNATHLRQKRARSQLSCIPCRNGKLKCNRVREPACDQCIKRNRETTCAWAPPPARQKSSNQNVKGRIRQLESQVVDLINQQSGNRQSHGTRLGEQPTPPSSTENEDESMPRRDEVECASKPFGQLKISKNEISYVGDTHWMAILHTITSLKRELEDEEDTAHVEDDNSPDIAWRHDPTDTSTGWDEQNQTASGGLGFMLGSSGNVTREQLIASVPEKRTTDRLLSLWFNSPDPFKLVLHAPTFQAEYRSFWRDSTQTPTMWLGLLFAILALAASFGLRDCSPGSPAGREISAEVNKYHELAAEAAVLADFTKPKPHTIECLLLYGAGVRSSNAFVNVWLLIGLCIRLALRMGYHRDPSNYPAISAFDGEMRRRVWAIISMMEVLLSFQLALPSMVKTTSPHSDTQPPRNLLDRDFDMDIKELPPSRGMDELTPASYTRTKLRVVSIFAEAAELNHATLSPSHEEMMKLDRRLEEIRAQIPPVLRMLDISELVTDPAEQLMCRFNIDLLYLKTKILIHRRAMNTPFARLLPREQELGIGMSRQIAVESALNVLHHHSTIHTASQPGGQLETVKYFMGSLSTHDTLLAAMVICLELSQQISTAPVSSPDGAYCPRRPVLMEALERSQQIWESTGRRGRSSRFQGQESNIAGGYMSEETEKAAIAMRVMLKKVREKFPAQVPPDRVDERQDAGMADIPSVSPPDSMPSSGIVSNNAWHFATPTDAQSESYDAAFTMADSLQYPNSDQLEYLGDMLDTSGTIDWSMFDTNVNQSSQEGHFSNAPHSLAQTLNMPGAGNATMGIGGASEVGACHADWMTLQDIDGTCSFSNIPGAGLQWQ